MISLKTGQSTSGHGGDVRVIVGTGDTQNGGDIIATAGETTDKASVGGNIVLTAGKASSEHFADGGDGGHMHPHGGIAMGKNPETDNGGNITLTGGYALTGRGGSFVQQTGYGAATSSGSFQFPQETGKGRSKWGNKCFSGTTSHGNSGTGLKTETQREESLDYNP